MSTVVSGPSPHCSWSGVRSRVGRRRSDRAGQNPLITRPTLCPKPLPTHKMDKTRFGREKMDVSESPLSQAHSYRQTDRGQAPRCRPGFVGRSFACCHRKRDSMQTTLLSYSASGLANCRLLIEAISALYRREIASVTPPLNLRQIK